MNLFVLQHKLAALDDQISTQENAWYGTGLASSLAELEPLVRRYSNSPETSDEFRLTLFGQSVPAASRDGEDRASS